MKRAIESMLRKTIGVCVMSLSLTGISTAVFAAGTLSPSGSGVAPVTIKSHNVKVKLNNGFACTEVSQIFSNPNTGTVEAVYAFPLPKSASLSEVQVLVGETVINGEVVEKAKAEKIYNDEKTKGNNAGLASKNGFQDFNFRIANIKPGNDITVKFVYYQPLEIDTGVGRYVYPLEEGNTDEAAISFWERNDKVVGKTTLTLDLKSAWPLSRVRVPGLSPLKVKDLSAKGEYKAEFDLPNGLKKDFVFYYSLQENLPGRLEVIPYRRSGSGDGTFMMVVTPGLDLKPLNAGADYIFILDISGSMSGEKIRKMCEGVSKALGKMSGQDRFRVVTFESSAREMTSNWVLATPENVNNWIKKVKTINSKGGTNLYAGLSLAVKKLDADRVASVILITDGVTNTGVISPKSFYKLMKKYDVRVFGFLMGNSANWPLMRTICDASGGFYAGVSNSDDIIGQIMLAKQKITHECLRDAKIKISGVPTYDLTGDDIGKVYCGQQIVVFGRYKKGGKATVTLKARLTGAEKVYSTEFNFPEVDTDNPELERLWALSRIEMFETLTNAGLMPATESQSLVKDIGVKYQLVTDETSMLVLSDSKFSEHKIERHNKKRIAVEHAAQSARVNAPAKNYRVDTGGSNKKSKKNNMFKFNAPRVGGGAIDPILGMMMILSGALAGLSALRKGKKK